MALSIRTYQSLTYSTYNFYNAAFQNPLKGTVFVISKHYRYNDHILPVEEQHIAQACQHRISDQMAKMFIDNRAYEGCHNNRILNFDIIPM